MKLKILILAISILGFSSCVEKICPTYTDIDEPQQIESVASENM
jgi:hypothetical protein